MYARSVVSIGSYAFAYCSSLKAVVILSTSISIGSDAFKGNSALTRLNATEALCAQVRNSCSGTCTQFRQCPSPPAPAPSSAPGLSIGIIAIIIISSLIGVIAIVLLISWFFRSKQRSINKGAVGALEMPSAPEQRMENSTIVQGQVLTSPTSYVHPIPQGQVQMPPTYYAHPIPQTSPTSYVQAIPQGGLQMSPTPYAYGIPQGQVQMSYVQAIPQGQVQASPTPHPAVALTRGQEVIPIGFVMEKL